jgi:hypothetical protein
MFRRLVPRIVDALDDQPQRAPTPIAQATLVANVSTVEPFSLREPKVRARNATSAWSDIARRGALREGPSNLAWVVEHPSPVDRAR